MQLHGGPHSLSFLHQLPAPVGHLQGSLEQELLCRTAVGYLQTQTTLHQRHNHKELAVVETQQGHR